METELRRFVCQDDDGNAYTVVEYQKIIETRLLSGRTERTDGMKRLVLLGGGHVNFIDESTFLIVANGKTIRKV